MINQVQGAGISTEQQKKTWLINWYFENDPTSSIYLATLRNPALVASYQTSPGNLYGTPFATGMENYFQKIKAHFGQSMFDQLLTEFAQQSNLYVDEIKVDEWHIYGSSRLGVYEANRTISKRVARDLNNDNQITNNEYVIETPEEVLFIYSSYQLERGAKRYELANHLGNVLTVISDKKTANFTGTNFTHFTADRISATDYSPFGAPLPGRTWNGGEYRFGFNSMEKDNEINGIGNAYDFGARIYDSRLGRWMSVDPLFDVYYFLSPFVGLGNIPLRFYDPDGKKIICNDKNTQKMVLKAINSTAVGKFVFNSKNELVCVSKKGDIKKHSMVFQEMLLAGIKSDVPILIKKSDLAYNTETKEYENVSDYGEGATFSEESILEYENGEKVIQKSSSKIYFTGRDEIVKDNQNRDMVMTSSDIIVHELVGHAIPFATESCTGDALLNENLVRLQCGKRQRHLMDLESESEAKKKESN